MGDEDQIAVVALALLVIATVSLCRFIYRGTAKVAQRRLYRRAFLIGSVTAAVVTATAWAASHLIVPLWIGQVVVVAAVVAAVPGALWLRSRLERLGRDEPMVLGIGA